MITLAPDQLRNMLLAHIEARYDGDRARAAKAWGTYPEQILRVMYDGATLTPAMRRAIGVERRTVYVLAESETAP